MFDQALILSIGKFREYDMWVKLLTRQTGICTAFAFGASKSRRRFAGCLDTFNIVQASIEKSRKKEFLQLKETKLVDTFAFRNDWKLIGIATNCIRFIEALGISPETSEKSYDFILDFFKILPKYTDEAVLLPPLFRFKLACLQGYAPNLSSCVRCDCDGITQNGMGIFSVQEGGIICKECELKLSPTMRINVSSETLDYLQDVQKYSTYVWLDEKIPLFIASQYGKIVDAFMHYHLGLEWQRNKFVHV